MRGIPLAEARSRREPFGWLAFHRPPNGEVSTPVDRKPCGQDVLRRVDIGVRLVPAGYASEDRLALAGLPGGVLAGVAGLRCVPGVDLDHGRTVVTGRVSQCEEEPGPALAEDGPVQSSLLRDVAARLLDGAPRAGRHILDPQVLDRHQAVIAYQTDGAPGSEVDPP